MENEIVNQSIIKNRLTCDFFQAVSFIMTVIFALMPIFAFFEPENNGLIFIFLSYMEIAALIFFAAVNILLKILNFPDESFLKILKSGLKSILHNKHGLLLLIVYILSVVSAFLSSDRSRSFFGTDFRPDGVLMYSSFFAVFVFASCIKKKKLKNIVIWVYIVSFIAVSLVMVQQYYGIIGTASTRTPGKFGQILKSFYEDIGIRTGHFYKGYTGTFYNLNHMGYYAVICSMLITGFFIKSDNIILKIILGILASYSYWVIILNDTFGAYVAVFASTAIIPIIIFVRQKKKNMRIVLRLISPFLLFVMVSVGFTCLSDKDNGSNTIEKNISSFSSDIKKFADRNNKEQSTAFSGRWAIWTATLDMIKERPLIGYGADNLKKEYTERNVKLDRAHCEFLEFAVSSGIPAAVFYAFAIGWIILKRLTDNNILESNNAYLPFLMAVFGYLISALVGVFLFYTAVHFMIMLGLLSYDSENV